MKTPYQVAYVETHLKSGLPKMTKDELIEWLIKDDMETFRQQVEGNDYSYLDMIMRDGFIGYRKQTVKQLRQEYNERKSQ